MKEKDCLKELRAIKDVTFATVDEKGCPQARIIDVMLVDDERIYFCTSRGKDFHHQPMRDGKVAVPATVPQMEGKDGHGGEWNGLCEEIDGGAGVKAPVPPLVS